MMARPQEQRRPWTKEEDQKLIECKNTHGHLTWPDMAMLAGLERSGKSCRERWNNCLSPHVKRGNFSQEEDDTILRLQLHHRNRWALIATHLPGRTDNAIKNRWNNHLKNKLGRSTDENIPNPQSSRWDQPDTTQLFHPKQNISNTSSITTPFSASQIANPCSTSEAYLEFLGGYLLRDDETIHESFGGDKLEYLIAGFAALIPNVYPNETNFGGDYSQPWMENEFMPN